MSKAKPLLIEAFGQSKTIREWSEDRRCQVGLDALTTRLGRMGWEAERAITEPRHRRLYKAFGERKQLMEWSRDPRCLVSARTLKSRVDAEWDFEKCLATPLEPRAPSKPRRRPEARLPSGRTECFTAFGETKSLKAWSKDPRCAVRYELLRRRLVGGWALEEAVAVPPHGGSPIPSQRIRPSAAPSRLKRKLFAAFGEKRTLAKWADDPRCGVCLATLRMRIANGMPFKRALRAQPLPRERGAAFTFRAFGETKTVRQWAEDHRCVVTLEQLTRRLGYGNDVEESITKPAHVPPELEAFGERKRVCDWAKDPRCRVTLHVLNGRLSKGWPLERAIVTEPRAPKPKQARGKGPESPKTGE